MKAPHRRTFDMRLLTWPAIGLLLIWTFVPLGCTLYFSLRRYSFYNPAMTGWAGFDNYLFLLQGPGFLPSLWNTLLLVGGVLAATVILGTILAALLDMDVWGRGIARLLMISPFFVMPSVAALIWKNLLMHPANGLFAWLAQLVGVTPIDWFTSIPLLSIGIIVSWQWIPFATLILLTALQSLDTEQMEAARIDGAHWFARFRFIILPHLGRPITVVIMIETIFLLAIFAEILVTTSGGPGDASTNLAYLIYKKALLDYDIGGASAGGIVAVILANIVAIFLVRTVARNLD